MPVTRSQNTRQLPLKIVGSSVYGIYDKMSSERTINMTISDDALVPYPGYKVGINNSSFGNASEGRGLYESQKLNKLFAVFDNKFFEITLTYNHHSQTITGQNILQIGTLDTLSGPVYFAENNKPQILISDNSHLYLYDPELLAGTFVFTTNFSGAVPPPITTANSTLTFNQALNLTVGEPVTLSNMGGALPTGLNASIKYYVANPIINSTTTTIQLALNAGDAYSGNEQAYAGFSSNGTGVQSLSTAGSFQDISTDFTPGYITFHDTYFLVAASQDTIYSPPANNTWRLSGQNNGFVWQSIAQSVGLLETKPDNTKAVIRFPSKGNMILVMGKSVTEMWFDTGAQLFPYQRQDQGSIDYGCVSPATVAFMDEIVIWLAANEKSGPIIMYTTGGLPTKITTDGIDFQLSQLNNPQSSQGFLYRKNGHLFYHLNFYLDNISFVVDLTLDKIYQACDQNSNYYAMGQVVWYNNQYFSISKNDGNLYIFDTVFTTYQTTDSQNELIDYEIPRIRICPNIRLPSQDYFILNDIGFTIETGETNYQYQDQGPIRLLTEDGNFLVTEGSTAIYLVAENGNFLVAENGNFLISEQTADSSENFLIAEQNDIVPVTPRVDFCISYDGGASFSSDFPYVLNPIGKRRNRLMWWQGGLVNDAVPQFKFWGIGRCVCMDGIVNIRQ